MVMPIPPLLKDGRGRKGMGREERDRGGGR